MTPPDHHEGAIEDTTVSEVTDVERLDAAIALVEAAAAYRGRTGLSAEALADLPAEIRQHLGVLDADRDRGMLVMARLVLEAANHSTLRIGSFFDREWSAMAQMARVRMNREVAKRGQYDVPQEGDRF